MMRVLLLDDNIAIRDAVTDLLMLKGYSVLSAGNGAEGFRMLETMDTPPHVIITDVNMPIMDGLAFMAQLRASPLWRAIPCVVLSGSPDDQARALACEMTAFLLKPFRIEELLTILQDILK